MLSLHLLNLLLVGKEERNEKAAVVVKKRKNVCFVVRAGIEKTGLLGSNPFCRELGEFILFSLVMTKTSCLHFYDDCNNTKPFRLVSFK